jgi:hypothetical protein
MRRGIVAALVAVLVVASGAVGAAAAQEEDVGDAVVQNASALPQTSQGETIISGLDDPDLALIGVEFVSSTSRQNVDGTVRLRIRSDSSKRIEVVDAFGSGGESIAILRPESRSLSQGVNVVEIDVRTFRGTAVVNVMGSGDTAQIPVRAGQTLNIPDTRDAYVFGAVLVAAAVVALLYAIIQAKFAGQEQEREL